VAKFLTKTYLLKLKILVFLKIRVNEMKGLIDIVRIVNVIIIDKTVKEIGIEIIILEEETTQKKEIIIMRMEREEPK